VSRRIRRLTPPFVIARRSEGTIDEVGMSCEVNHRRRIKSIKGVYYDFCENPRAIPISKLSIL
jgi:hypothetical protein